MDEKNNFKLKNAKNDKEKNEKKLQKSFSFSYFLQDMKTLAKHETDFVQQKNLL